MGPMGGDEINLIRGRELRLACGLQWLALAQRPGHPRPPGWRRFRGAQSLVESLDLTQQPDDPPGPLFLQWRGDAFVGALSARPWIRVDLDETTATKGDQWPMNARIREVEQARTGRSTCFKTVKAHLLRVTPN